jgi:hypothetical protein
MKSRRPEEERRKKKEETHNKQQTRIHQCVNASANGERENMMENRHNDTTQQHLVLLRLACMDFNNRVEVISGA